jgi:transcriptional regulator with XRE-family HTH domain
MNHLSDRMKHARVSAGLTQGELAELISEMTGRPVLKGTISAWENGRVASPSAAALIAVQSATGYRADWIQNGVLPQKIEPPKAKRSPQTPAPLDKQALLGAITDVLAIEQRPDKAATRILRLYVARAGKAKKPTR